MNNKPPVKFSMVLSFVSWTSFFVLSWMLLLRWIESDVTAWGFLTFFLLLAVFSGAVAATPKAGKNAS